jgi:hypothetical protein
LTVAMKSAPRICITDILLELYSISFYLYNRMPTITQFLQKAKPAIHEKHSRSVIAFISDLQEEKI